MASSIIKTILPMKPGEISDCNVPTTDLLFDYKFASGGAANRPTSGYAGYHILTFVNGNTGYGVQVGLGDNGIYTRKIIAGTYQSWTQLGG